MNYESPLQKVYICFPSSFINLKNELVILHGYTWFRLDDIYDVGDLDAKILSFCSREASKGLERKSRNYHRRGLSEYFGRDFSDEELDIIYTYLGNGINRELTGRFINSGFDMGLLG